MEGHKPQYYRKFAVSFSILIYHLFIRFAISLNLDTSIIIYGEAQEKAKGGEEKVSVTTGGPSSRLEKKPTMNS